MLIGMSKRIEIIQTLRGFAALLVVLHHFQNILQNDWPGIAQLLRHGHIGVDVFFIISGFVIYISTEDTRNRSVQGFLIRRFFRVIIPAWVAMLLLLCVKPPYLSSLLLSVLFIPLENSRPPTYGYNFLIVAWTLTYELIFYFIFALAMSSRFGVQHRGLLSAALIFGMVIVIQAVTGTYTLDANAVALLPDKKYFPMQILSLLGNPLFAEFVIGISFAWIYQCGLLSRLGKWRYLLFALGIELTLLTIKYQYKDGNGLTNSGLMACCLVMSCLMLQSLIDTENSFFLGRKAIIFFGFLGELSYSLYLIHPISKSIAMSKPVKNFWVEEFNSMLVFFLLLGCTFVAAYLFYKFIEIPSQKFGKTLISSIRQ